MARLLKDLENMVGFFRNNGYGKYIPARDLEVEIAKRFGVGNLTIKRVKQELDSYNLLKPNPKDFRLWIYPEILKKMTENEEEKYLNSVTE